MSPARSSLPFWPELFGHDPNVAIEHGIAVALQLNAAATRAFGFSAAGRSFQLLMIMDDDAVVLNCGHGVFGLLAVGARMGGLEINVIGLPGQRRKTHIHLRRGL